MAISLGPFKSIIPAEACPLLGYTAIALDTSGGHNIHTDTGFGTGANGRAYGVSLGDNGNRLYFSSRFLNGDYSTANVSEYTLSTPYDITTAVRIRETDLSVDFGSFYPEEMSWSKNGEYLYFGCINNIDRKVWSYSLSTAWDISTMTFMSATYLPGFPSTFVHKNVVVDNDTGLKALYIDPISSLRVISLDLSTPWDLTTATLSSYSTNTPLFHALFTCSGGGVLNINNTVIDSYKITTPFEAAWESTASNTINYDFLTVFLSGIIARFVIDDKLFIIGKDESVLGYHLEKFTLS